MPSSRDYRCSIPCTILAMATLIPLATFILVAAITPGPNNLAVLNAATERGATGAAAAIAGVLLGSLALLGLALGGASALFETQPALVDGMSLIGAGYLAWLGAAMIARAAGSPQPEARAEVPGGIIAMTSLQFANPKAWTMTLTAAAAARRAMDPWVSVLVLVALFLTIPTACLVVWAWFGLRIVPALQRSGARVWFDRSMGLLLLGSAIALLMETRRRGIQS